MKRTAAALIALATTGGATALATSERTPTTQPRLAPTATPQACKPEAPTISTRTPSQPLLDTLGTLRRPAQPADRPPEAVTERAFPMDGLMFDAARRVREGTWLLPVETLYRCKGDPVEGVAVVSGEPPQAFPAYPLDLIRQGGAYNLDICAGPMHDKLGIRGLVPDGVTNVTVTAKDGTITEATPDQNTFAFELARPGDSKGLPAHITYTAPSGPQRVAVATRPGYTQPCEPPSKSTNGQRRDPPTKLKTPKGAKIELQTSRWEAEDTGPLVVGATYRTTNGRCLIVGPEKRLPKGYRFCVTDRQLKQQRSIARAARLPNGDVVMAGFADPKQVAYVLMQNSNVIKGTRRLALAKQSGAFFVTHKGPRHAGGRFEVRIALRGKPIRYASTRTITLAKE